jgi:hypothetical protein
MRQLNPWTAAFAEADRKEWGKRRQVRYIRVLREYLNGIHRYQLLIGGNPQEEFQEASGRTAAAENRRLVGIYADGPTGGELVRWLLVERNVESE